MQPQPVIPDVIPNTAIIFPREIPNRINYHFNGKLLDPVFVRRPGWYVRVVRNGNGVKFENHQLEH